MTKFNGKMYAGRDEKRAGIFTNMMAIDYTYDQILNFHPSRSFIIFYTRANVADIVKCANPKCPSHNGLNRIEWEKNPMNQ